MAAPTKRRRTAAATTEHLIAPVDAGFTLVAPGAAVTQAEIRALKKLWQSYPAPKPKTQIGNMRAGSSAEANYHPLKDLITLPSMLNSLRQVKNLLHELVHSTGVKKRLARDFFRKPVAGGVELPRASAVVEKAEEEVCAELGAEMLCLAIGIRIDREATAQYVEYYSLQIHQQVTNSTAVVQRAAKNAKAAVLYIAGDKAAAKELREQINYRSVMASQRETTAEGTFAERLKAAKAELARKRGKRPYVKRGKRKAVKRNPTGLPIEESIATITAVVNEALER